METLDLYVFKAENFKLDSLDSFKKIYSSLTTKQPPFIDE